MFIAQLQYIGQNYQREFDSFKSITNIKYPHKVIIFRSGNHNYEDYIKEQKNIFIFNNKTEKGIFPHIMLMDYLMYYVNVPYYLSLEDDFLINKNVNNQLSRLEKLYDKDKVQICFSNRRMAFTSRRGKSIYKIFQPTNDPLIKNYNSNINYISTNYEGFGFNDGLIINSGDFVEWIKKFKTKEEFKKYCYPHFQKLTDYCIDGTDQGFNVFRLKKYQKADLICIQDGWFHYRGSQFSFTPDFKREEEHQRMINNIDNIIKLFLEENKEEIERLKEFFRII